MAEPNRINRTSELILGKIIAQKVTEFMKSEANRADFENWYFKRYGRTYHWKTKKE